MHPGRTLQNRKRMDPIYFLFRPRVYTLVLLRGALAIRPPVSDALRAASALTPDRRDRATGRTGLVGGRATTAERRRTDAISRPAPPCGAATSRGHSPPPATAQQPSDHR